MKSIKKYKALFLLLTFPLIALSQQTVEKSREKPELFTSQDYIMILIVIAFLLLLIYVLAKSAISLTKLVIEKNKNLFLLLGVSLVSVCAQAQTHEPSKVPDWLLNPEFYFASFIFFIIIATIYVLYKVNFILINILSPKLAIVESEKIHKPNFVQRLYARLIDSVPVAHEKDILLDHDYDGIQELDNNLPPWWKYGFYVTILFAVVYLFTYHVSGTGKLQLDEYKEELALAEFQKQERMKASAENINEENVMLLTDVTRINSGKENYVKLCSACHRNDGGGQVGPNLTDEYWIHGGGIKNIFKTITYGVPDKGMLKWSNQLSPKQIQEIASFVITLHDSKPAGAKEPQGELYVPEEPSKNLTDSLKIDSSSVDNKILTLKDK